VHIILANVAVGDGYYKTNINQTGTMNKLPITGWEKRSLKFKVISFKL